MPPNSVMVRSTFCSTPPTARSGTDPDWRGASAPAAAPPWPTPRPHRRRCAWEEDRPLPDHPAGYPHLRARRSSRPARRARERAPGTRRASSKRVRPRASPARARVVAEHLPPRVLALDVLLAYGEHFFERFGGAHEPGFEGVHDGDGVVRGLFGTARGAAWFWSSAMAVLSAVMSCLITAESSAISRAGSSNMPLRLASCARRSSFWLVPWMPCPMRLAMVARTPSWCPSCSEG